jgi:hypothetical protein
LGRGSRPFAASSLPRSDLATSSTSYSAPCCETETWRRENRDLPLSSQQHACDKQIIFPDPRLTQHIGSLSVSGGQAGRKPPLERCGPRCNTPCDQESSSVWIDAVRTLYTPATYAMHARNLIRGYHHLLDATLGPGGTLPAAGNRFRPLWVCFLSSTQATGSPRSPSP